MRLCSLEKWLTRLLSDGLDANRNTMMVPVGVRATEYIYCYVAVVASVAVDEFLLLRVQRRYLVFLRRGQLKLLLVRIDERANCLPALASRPRLLALLVAIVWRLLLLYLLRSLAKQGFGWGLGDVRGRLPLELLLS